MPELKTWFLSHEGLGPLAFRRKHCHEKLFCQAQARTQMHFQDCCYFYYLLMTWNQNRFLISNLKIQRPSFQCSKVKPTGRNSLSYRLNTAFPTSVWCLTCLLLPASSPQTHTKRMKRIRVRSADCLTNRPSISSRVTHKSNTAGRRWKPQQQIQVWKWEPNRFPDVIPLNPIWCLQCKTFAVF